MQRVGAPLPDSPAPQVNNQTFNATPAIPDTAAERTARLVICPQCNAPRATPCIQIRWHGNKPYARERPHHWRRFKSVGRVEARREKRDTTR
jgi:hypothetical protein